MIIANGFTLGRTAPMHTLRTGETPNNVDRSLTHNNIVYIDELKGRSIEQYTNDEMQPFIDEHNAKQKRKDRRIEKTYTEWHKQDKNMMKGLTEGEDPKWVHEFVLCYGNHEDYWHKYFDPNTTENQKQEMHKEADREYGKMIFEFKKRYPHAHIVYAVLHADEPAGSLHLHLAVQFRGNQYERGLSTRVSTSRGLEQDGFEHIHSTSLAKEQGGFQMERMFKDFRHNVMNKQMIELGFEIKEEEHGAKHYDCPTYNKIMQEAEQSRAEAAQRLEKVSAIEAFTKELNEIEAIERLPSYDPKQVKKVEVKQGLFSQKEEVIQMSEEQFDALRASADTKAINRETEKKIKAQQKAIQKVIEAASTDREKDLQAKVDQLEERLTKAERTIQEKNIIIEQKERLVKKLESILEIIKDSLERRGLWKIFENLFERKDRTQ